MQQYQIIELKSDINPVIIRGMEGVILELVDLDTFIVEFVKEDGTNYEYDGEFTFFLKKSDLKELD